MIAIVAIFIERLSVAYARFEQGLCRLKSNQKLGKYWPNIFEYGNNLVLIIVFTLCLLLLLLAIVVSFARHFLTASSLRQSVPFLWKPCSS